jgi:hypothetical protein
MDIKKLIVEELKKEGMDIAEDAAISAVKAIFKVLPKVALATENKFDDLLIPVLGVVEPKILELLDKIDGEVG